VEYRSFEPGKAFTVEYQRALLYFAKTDAD
jgi:hypothetical protein